MEEVILVNYTGRKGGGPIDALEMAKAFSLNGHKVIAILSKDISNKADWEDFSFEKLIWIDSSANIFTLFLQLFFFRLTVGKKIKESLQEYGIRFIYCPMVSILTSRINRLFSKEKIAVVNHDPIPHSGDRTKILAKIAELQDIYDKADCIVVHSENSKMIVEEQYHGNKPVCYVPLGPQNVRGTGVSKLATPSDYVNFLFFGRIEKYKGIEVLLKAYQKVKQNFAKCSLSIVGNGDFSPYLELSRDLSDCTIVNQWIADEEVGDYFLGNNLVLVLPYLDATQSGPVLIGYQFGIPAIVSNTGGLKEQVNEKTGLLVEAGDVESLATAMERVCQNPDWIHSTKDAIQEYMEQISWRNSAKTIVQCMNNMNEDGEKDDT